MRMSNYRALGMAIRGMKFEPARAKAAWSSLQWKQRKSKTVEPEKNLHASIPAALLAEAEQAANADRISVDELVRDAVERRLKNRRRQNLYVYGELQARKLDIQEEDVDRIIHEFREEDRQRRNVEPGR